MPPRAEWNVKGSSRWVAKGSDETQTAPSYRRQAWNSDSKEGTDKGEPTRPRGGPFRDVENRSRRNDGEVSTYLWDEEQYRALLRALEGKWLDSGGKGGSIYEVSTHRSGESLSVLTLRPDGHKRQTDGLIRMEQHEGGKHRICWGDGNFVFGGGPAPPEGEVMQSALWQAADGKRKSFLWVREVSEVLAVQQPVKGMLKQAATPAVKAVDTDSAVAPPAEPKSWAAIVRGNARPESKEAPQASQASKVPQPPQPSQASQPSQQTKTKPQQSTLPLHPEQSAPSTSQPLQAVRPVQPPQLPKPEQPAQPPQPLKPLKPATSAPVEPPVQHSQPSQFAKAAQAARAESAQQSSEPSKHVEPLQAAQAEPSWSPSQPSKTSKPGRAPEASQSLQPSQSSQLLQTSEPFQPSEHLQSTQPLQTSFQQSSPLQPSQPWQPSQPSQPSKPLRSSQPSQPADSAAANSHSRSSKAAENSLGNSAGKSPEEVMLPGPAVLPMQPGAVAAWTQAMPGFSGMPAAAQGFAPMLWAPAGFTQGIFSAGFMPFMPMMQPVPQLPPDPIDQLGRQIEYYFSDENLSRDHFLKKQMSSDGFVPLITIGGFARVRQIAPPLTDYGVGLIGALCQAIQPSQFLELDESRTKVRRRNGWEMYVANTASNQ